jgi:hypothetical protein
MSTYTTAEAGLLAAITAYGFSSANSSRGNFNVLNNEGVTQAAVLLQAAPSEFADNLGGGRGSMGKRQQRHRIALILFQRRNANDGDNYTNLLTLCDAVVAYLDTYPGLNGTSGVKRAEIVSASEPRIRRDSDWLYQTVIVDVLTETSPALVETIR